MPIGTSIQTKCTTPDIVIERTWKMQSTIQRYAVGNMCCIKDNANDQSCEISNALATRIKHTMWCKSLAQTNYKTQIKVANESPTNIVARHWQTNRRYEHFPSIVVAFDSNLAYTKLSPNISCVIDRVTLDLGRHTAYRHIHDVNIQTYIQKIETIGTEWN